MPQRPKVFLFDHSPHLRGEWDYEKNVGIDPETISFGNSTIKANWVCHKGHRYACTIANRTGLGRGCPYCAGRYPVVGENDLATTRPDLAKQLLDTTLAIRLMQYTNKKVDWVCPLGHIYSAAPNTRVHSDRGCPVCHGTRTLSGYNDLWTTNPEIAVRLLDQTDGYRYTYGSNKKLRFACEIGHTWLAVSMGLCGCPICSNKQILIGFNDLWTTHPEIAKQLVDPEDGYRVVAGSLTKKVKWGCELGHTLLRSVHNIRIGKGCPVCSNQIVVPGVNDIKSQRPDLYEQLVDKSLGTKICHSGDVSTEWVCQEGHVVTTTARFRQKHECRYCSGYILSGYNDAATLFPDTAKYCSEIEVLRQETRTSKRVVGWFCDVGHTWSAPIYAVLDRESLCTYCSGKDTLTGYNDTATTHPHLLTMTDDHDTLRRVSAGSHTKVEWRCSIGHRWSTAIRYVAVDQTGCPKCSFQWTSKIEGRLRDILSRSFNVLSEDHTYRLPVPYRKNRSASVDIYLEIGTKKVVVEYDGAYFHRKSGSVSRDSDKTKALIAHGYFVVRVREQSPQYQLSHLPIDDLRLYQIMVPYSTKDDNLIEAVQQIKEWLEEKNEVQTDL